MLRQSLLVVLLTIPAVGGELVADALAKDDLESAQCAGEGCSRDVSMLQKRMEYKMYNQDQAQQEPECVIKVKHNNLAGLGPKTDLGEESLYFKNFGTIAGKLVDIRITAVSPYTGANVKANGIVNCHYGRINIDVNSEVDFNFQIVDPETNEELTVEEFPLAILDADMNNKGADEFVKAKGFQKYLLSKHTELLVQDEGDGLTGFHATTVGIGADNPYDPLRLTDQQRNRMIFLSYKDVSNVKLTFGMNGEGTHDRNMLFMIMDPSPVNTCLGQPAGRFIDFRRLVWNNLDGHLEGPENIRFDAALTAGSVSLDLVVSSNGIYEANDYSNTGLIPGTSNMMSINLKADTSANLKYQFVVSGTDTPYTVDRFSFAVLDVDKSSKTTEEIVVHGWADYFLPEDTTVQKVPTADGSIKFVAGAKGNEGDNPSDPMQLTQEEARHVVGFDFTARDSFDIEVSSPVSKRKGNGRNYFFTGKTVVCED